MTIDLQALADKVRRYRDQFTASPSEVSLATGIAEERLLRVEAAELEPTGDEVLIIADYFKCDYRFFISNEALAPFEETETLFRNSGAELTKQDRWAIQEFLFLCDCEEYLDRQSQRQPAQRFTFAKRGSYYKTHGADAATALRTFLTYKPTEVRPNVFAELRKLGMHVFRRSLQNSRISGIYVRHPTAGDCVLVNFDENVYRQQFTAAHEAGHAILDDEEVGISYLPSGEANLSEVRANVFASNFLMPPDLLKTVALTSGWGVNRARELAKTLGVSTTALSYALSNVGALTAGQAKVLRESPTPAEERNDAELPTSLSPAERLRRAALLRRGLSSNYVKLAFDVYREHLISAGRLAEMLLVQPNELATLAALFGMSVEYAT